MAVVVDSKLLHLVRKLWQVESNRSPTDEEDDQVLLLDTDHCRTTVARRLVPTLQAKHREYQRKNVGDLTTAVTGALAYIRRHECTPSNNQPDKPSQRVEKREIALDEDEAAYDRAATVRDTIASSMSSSSNSGGGLNASLRNRYKQVSMDRSTAAAAAATAPLQENESASPLKPPLDTRHNTHLSAHDSNSVLVQQHNDSTMDTSPPKRKKIRRTVLRRTTDTSDPFEPNHHPSASTTAIIAPVSVRPTERYSDLGGMGDIIQTIRQLIDYPVTRPELYRHLGVEPPRGVLLRGPPGTGKTHLANAVAGQLGIPFFRVSAPELVSGVSGESESRIRALFQTASDMAPALIFLDEIDAVAPKRSDSGGGSSRGMEQRMVAQLLTSMDRVAPHNNRQQNVVVVLAATNRPDALDPALRRAGRFDKEILLGVPDEEARERILRSMTKNMRLQCTGDSSNISSGKIIVDSSELDSIESTSDQPHLFDFKLLARKTPGFVGADLKSLAKEAAVLAINRIFRDVLKDTSLNDDDVTPLGSEGVTDASSKDDAISGCTSTDFKPLSAEELAPLYVTMDDFLAAIPLVQPSSQREGFATVPNVSWDDIGALHSIREELTLSVLEPIRSPEKFKALGLQLPAGVLLYGPPGCGKTLVAKAIAGESGANFISVKGPELLDKYVGESERAVRVLFERARSSSPCIIFFDELDSLVPRRGSDSGGSGVSERVVNQLLTEMDGLESRRSVFVIAATNRPELIDPAMMRPGRLDKLLYVPLPTPTERESILRALCSKVSLGDDVDLKRIGYSPRAEGFSGADCAALLREAGLAVLKEEMAASKNGSGGTFDVLRAKHFHAAFDSVMPSVSKKDQARYDKIRDSMARARSRGGTSTARGDEEEGTKIDATERDD